ncbi:putative Geranylgeranyl diphosphate reductase, chloroplastic [Cocos nucifera]|nr:putative Geranylgeranyl diphosphate reductase, chloroplastic [Cocos nucifera]
MAHYEDLAEMYVGSDVLPDFYGWVFPKYDHVAVGTGMVMSKVEIKKYQAGIRAWAWSKIAGWGGTKCFGEGIYFAAKSGRMCGEAITRIWNNNSKDVVIEEDLKKEYLRKWDGVPMDVPVLGSPTKDVLRE